MPNSMTVASGGGGGKRSRPRIITGCMFKFGEFGADQPQFLGDSTCSTCSTALERNARSI